MIMLKLKIKKRNDFYYILKFTLLLNSISHFLENVLHIGNVYYMSYICWMILFLYTLFIRSKIRKREIAIASVILMIFIMGAFSGLKLYGNTFLDLHLGVFTCMAYIVAMGVKTTGGLNQEEIYGLLETLIFIGILACLYAMIFQGSYAVLVLKRIDVGWNSWFYTSFFAQRNIFGEYCFLATVAALYIFLIKKMKKYLFFIALMGLQIYITNSRAALIAYCLVIGLSIYNIAKNKIVIIVMAFASLLFFASSFDIYGIIVSRMSHITSDGIDSGMIRINMWKDIIKEIELKRGIFCGYGLGSIEKFLYPIYEVGSSHNSYIDAIFSGGILYFTIVIYAIIYSFKRIIKNQDQQYKIIFLAAFISFMVYNSFEAGMSLFSSNYFSVIATLIFILFPRLYLKPSNKCVIKES